MANLNLWETDTTVSEFVEKMTTLPDAARIFFQIVDPNDAKKGVTKGITGANLKAAIGGGFSEVAVINNPTVGGSWSDISAHVYPNTADVLIFLAEGAGDRDSLAMGPVEFQELSTTFNEKSVIIDAPTPRIEQAQNLTTVTITGTFATLVTTSPITPISAMSQFLVNVEGIAGSISGAARGDIQIQRKIGTGAWTTRSSLSKNYMFLANFGNPPWGFGPAIDSPNTTETVAYRAQLKRMTTGSHNGSWNCESVFMTVTERPVVDPSTKKVLRVRRDATNRKLQYRLEGVDATSKLWVFAN